MDGKNGEKGAKRTSRQRVSMMLRLDVRSLYKQGMLKAGYTGEWRCLNGEEVENKSKLIAGLVEKTAELERQLIESQRQNQQQPISVLLI